MTLKEAVARACQEPTLLDALAWIAIWETERVVQQAIRNEKSGERNPDGSQWDTCFRLAFKDVMEHWNPRIGKSIYPLSCGSCGIALTDPHQHGAHAAHCRKVS